MHVFKCPLRGLLATESFYIAQHSLSSGAPVARGEHSRIPGDRTDVAVGSQPVTAAGFVRPGDRCPMHVTCMSANPDSAVALDREPQKGSPVKKS